MQTPTIMQRQGAQSDTMTPVSRADSQEPNTWRKRCFHLGSNDSSHQGGNLHKQQVSRPWICVKI